MSLLLGEQFERSILERRGLGRALEARLGVCAPRRLSRRLRVIDVGRDGLERAPAGAADVGQVGRCPVGGADRLAHALGVANGAPAVGAVGLRRGQRHEPGEEALELAFAHALTDQPAAELLQLVVIAPGDPERAPGVGEPGLDVGGVACLPGALRVRERQQHPVQAGEAEGRHRHRDGEAAVVAVPEAEQRQHVLPLRSSDPDLALEPHQRVDAGAAARRARADPVRPARIGDVVAEGEGGAVLEWLVALADDAEHGARVAAHVGDVAGHGSARDRVAVLADREHCFERTLFDRPVRDRRRRSRTRRRGPRSG